jgi:hypothetical protein
MGRFIKCFKCIWFDSMFRDSHKWVTDKKKHRITVTILMESKGVKRVEVMHTDDRKEFFTWKKERALPKELIITFSVHTDYFSPLLRLLHLNGNGSYL